MTDVVSSEARLMVSVRERWENGAVVDVTIAALKPFEGWTVAVAAGGTIVNVWNAVVISNSGTNYILGAADYNGTVAAGAAISFGLQVDGPGPFALEAFDAVLADGMAVAPSPGAARDPAQGPPSPADVSPDASMVRSEPGTSPALPSRVAPPAAPGAAGAPASTAAVPADGVLTGGAVQTPLVQQISISAVAADEPAGDAFGLPVDTFAPGPLHTSGTEILDAEGRRAPIRGINWFGLETDIGVPHGLWLRNWREMMDDMKSLGFNVLRLPFSGDFARNAVPVDGVDAGLNPDLAGLDGLAILDRVADYADTIGLRIVLDYHRGSPGGGPNENGLWYGDGRTEADVIAEWRLMAERYRDKPAVIGADLMNEPHMATWGAAGGAATDWAAAAGRIGNAVLEVAPDWLVIVEGISNYHGDKYWWGGNLQGVASDPVRLDVPGRLVYSPHDYPPSVAAQPWFADGTPLPEVWHKNWGYLVEEGVAPVLLGEWGSRLATAEDLAWAAQLSAYLEATGVPWMWWALNPNSGDTGGIFADDWTTLRPEITRLLEPLLAETRPQIGFDDAASSFPQATFAVTLSAPGETELVVPYATTDGTATAGTDYVATAGTLTFMPGETLKTVAVPLLPDGSIEGDETFTLVLGGDAAASGPATATITDSSRERRAATLPYVDVTSMAVREGAGVATFRLVLSEPAAGDVALSFRAFRDNDGGDDGGDDGDGGAGTGGLPSGNVTIAAGEREAVVEIPTGSPGAGTSGAPVAHYTLELTAADGAAIRTGSATGFSAAGAGGDAVATAATQLTIDLIIENDWGSGALFNVALRNISDAPVTSWELALDLPFDVAELWSATLVSDEGDRVTLGNAEWNGAIAPGETITFGFISTAGGVVLGQLLAGADLELAVQ